jgi:CRISPR-associated RAMP protein (TIGR02581 family)
MHKRFLNHCQISLTLVPQGPLLIKSGQEGADPTKPDMEFVETLSERGRTVYLPGSSLKGAIRAHAERIVRTVGQSSRPQDDLNTLWASDPIKDKYDYLDLESTSEIHKQSSFTDRLFGNTAIASRVRIEDAYPADPDQIRLEERNGVAIDRVFGSVAVGPFNFQVCTAGAFRTTVHLKNFSLAQLGLLGLVLRDLHQGWFGLGFGKSRGLGTVTVSFERATVEYPGCIVDGNSIRVLGSQQAEWAATSLLGVGAFLTQQECQEYGVPSDDTTENLPVAAEAMDWGMGAQLQWDGERVSNLFRRAVPAWRQAVEGVAA